MSIGDRSEERLADQMGATTGSPTEITARAAGLRGEAAGLRGEQVMPDQQGPAGLGGQPVPVRSCWMCGIRLPANQMVADGGSACLDLRWYCRDTWGCTRRWTSHPARPAARRPDMAETPAAPAEQQAAGRGAARPVAV